MEQNKCGTAGTPAPATGEDRAGAGTITVGGRRLLGQPIQEERPIPPPGLEELMPY